MPLEGEITPHLSKGGRERCTHLKQSSKEGQGEIRKASQDEGGMFQENSIETCILSRVKQITSPGWMHETSARGWCTGKTQRDWDGEYM